MKFDEESRAIVEDAMTMTGRVGAGGGFVMGLGCTFSDGNGAGAPFDPWLAGSTWDGLVGISCRSELALV